MSNGEERTGAAGHIGYLLAVFVPVVGFVYGLALVISKDEEGPWVCGLAVLANVIYAAVLTVAVFT